MAWAIITIYTSKFALMDTQQLLKTSKYYSTCNKCDIEKPIGGVNPHPWQRCHSKKIKNPRRATEKNPENPRSNFYAIGLHFGKKSNFSRRKSNFSPPKFLMTFFSHQQFLHFYSLIDQKLRKQQLVPYFFSKNHLLFSIRKYVFSGEI